MTATSGPAAAGSTPEAMRIVRWTELSAGSTIAEAETEIDRIFFVSSATQSFASTAAKAAFRERWLGRYLLQLPQWFYVLLAADTPVAGSGAASREPAVTRVAGYLAGAVEDPARDPLFADIGYFAKLAPLTSLYPAHLHINLAPWARSLGGGSRLIGRFTADLEGAGAPGLHVVTGATSRNVGFYRRNGFEPLAERSWNGVDVVMLGRRLSKFAS